MVPALCSGTATEHKAKTNGSLLETQQLVGNEAGLLACNCSNKNLKNKFVGMSIIHCKKRALETKALLRCLFTFSKAVFEIHQRTAL